MAAVHPPNRAAPWATALSGALFVLLAVSPAQADGGKTLTLLGIPSATVAPHGLGFFALSSGTSDNAYGLDGSMALGFGLGDASKIVGLQVMAQITRLNDEFADSGYFSFKLSRQIGERTFVALQADHVGNWGDSKWVDTNAKAMVTWFTELKTAGDSFPLMFTLGAGNKIRNYDTDPGVFGGVGLGLTEQFATSIAYTGEFVDLGLSLKLNDRLTVTATREDLFDQKDQGSVSVSVSYAVHLFGK